jgi:hypothetical protein
LSATLFNEGAGASEIEKVSDVMATLVAAAIAVKAS